MDTLPRATRLFPRPRHGAALFAVVGAVTFVVASVADFAAPAPSPAAATDGGGAMHEAIREYESGRYAAARKHLMRAAQEGDLQAQEMLGTMLLLGAPTFPGVQRDPAGATVWLQLAALRGSPHARFVYCALTRKPGTPQWGDVRCRLDAPDPAPAKQPLHPRAMQEAREEQAAEPHDGRPDPQRL